MQFYKIDSYQPVADYLAETLRTRLNNGEKVFWLLTGGSAISVAAAVSKQLTNLSLDHLTVSLTDERFGEVGFADSNWQQLKVAGFSLPGAKLEPVLIGKDLPQTITHYDQILRSNLEKADFSIGLFGIGPDGHIAALYPHFPQLNEVKSFATSFNNSPKPPPLRTTMTIPAITQLHEAVVYAMGKEKWPQIEKLAQNLPVDEQPAQVLKALPKLTVYNDHQGEQT
jgi:6-phosphogluconolactonase